MGVTLEEEYDLLANVLLKDPLNWQVREKLALNMYKRRNAQLISAVEYIQEREKLFRDYLQLDPEHNLCKQELANLLQEKAMDTRKLGELYRDGKYKELSEQESLYKELTVLSPYLPRFRIRYAQVYYLLRKDRLSFDCTLKELIVIFYGENKEIVAKIDEFIFYEFEKRLTDINLVKILEDFLRSILEAVPLEPMIKKKLAQCLFMGLSLDTKENQTSAKIKQIYDECIRLDPENKKYPKEYLEYLISTGEELDKLEKTKQVQEQKIEIYFEILKYDPNNLKVRDKIKKLLLDMENEIYEKEDKGILKEKELASEYQRLYTNFLKLEPSNPTYKYSLANVIMERGKYIKGYIDRHNDEAYHLFQEVLNLDPTHYEARLRMALIRITQSRWNEANELLEILLEDHERFSGKDQEIEFSIAFAVTKAHLNDITKADEWLEKGKLLDVHRKYMHTIIQAQLGIQTCKNLKYYKVFKRGERETVLDSTSIDNLIMEYEEDRSFQSSPKLIIDLRHVKSPVIIGPKKSMGLSDSKIRILTYLVVSRFSKSLNDINESCFSNTSTEDSIKNTISLLRKDLAKVFGITKVGIMEYVLVTEKETNRYRWVLNGETSIIKEE